MMKVCMLLLLTIASCAGFVCNNQQQLFWQRQENCIVHPMSRTVLSSSPTSSSNQHSSNDNTEGTIETSNYYFYKRRKVFANLVASPTLVAAATTPLTASAAPPMTMGETENVKAKVERSLRPKPVKSLRPKLNLDFAVLLMRSSYNALDAIDCVAMDQFQRDFFFIRQAEYQPYVESLGPGFVKQGELADPYYFDFISFAQYATISRDVSGDPPVVFEEQQPAEEDEKTEESDDKSSEVKAQRFVPKVIRRDPSLLDNSLLPSKHAELVGKSILDKLNDTFGNTPSALPVIQPKSRPDANVIMASLKQLMNLFLINGFAWDGNVAYNTDSSKDDSTSGTKFVITFTSPATLWSGQALKLRGAKPTNDFYLKTARILLENAGYSVVNPSVKYTNSQEITTFTIV